MSHFSLYFTSKRILASVLLILSWWGRIELLYVLISSFPGKMRVLSGKSVVVNCYKKGTLGFLVCVNDRKSLKDISLLLPHPMKWVYVIGVFINSYDVTSSGSKKWIFSFSTYRYI